MLLTGIGFALPIWGLCRIAVGLKRKSWKIVAIGVILPVFYWIFYIALWEADRKFIQSETEKNDGQLPEWVW
jgi:hypothetical protein